MAPKRAAQRQEILSPNLPEVLIPPSDAKEEQKAAYWIELLDNPEELRKATGTTEFFQLLNEFPASLWGDRLSIYVYRLPDDDGMMVKNETGARKYIKPIIRQPINEDWLATKHGGGKYLLYLKARQQSLDQGNHGAHRWSAEAAARADGRDGWQASSRSAPPRHPHPPKLAPT